MEYPKITTIVSLTETSMVSSQPVVIAPSTNKDLDLESKVQEVVVSNMVASTTTKVNLQAGSGNPVYLVLSNQPARTSSQEITVTLTRVEVATINPYEVVVMVVLAALNLDLMISAKLENCSIRPHNLQHHQGPLELRLDLIELEIVALPTSPQVDPLT